MCTLSAMGGLAVIRRGDARDVFRVAELHVGLITEGFLSTFGRELLDRLYDRLVRTRGCFLLVAEADRQIVGFVAGCFSTRRLYASFLAHDGLGVLLRNWSPILGSWRQVLETLRHGSGPSARRVDCELLAIAVRPSHRGMNVGTRLIDGLLDEAGQRGARTVGVVVGANNEAAIHAYRSAGFAVEESFELHKGVPSLFMRHCSAA